MTKTTTARTIDKNITTTFQIKMIKINVGTGGSEFRSIKPCRIFENNITDHLKSEEPIIRVH